MALVANRAPTDAVGDIFIDTAGDRLPWRVESVNAHGEAQWVVHSPADVCRGTGVSEHDVALFENAYAASPDNHIKIDDKDSPVVLGSGGAIALAQGVKISPLSGGEARINLVNNGTTPTQLQIGDFHNTDTGKAAYISATVTNGGRSIDAAGHNLVDDDIGIILSNDVINTVHAHVGGDTRPAEMFKVRRIDGDRIWLERALKDTFTVDVQIGQFKLDGTGDNPATDNVDIQNIDFSGSQNGNTGTTANQTGVVIMCSSGASVRDCKFAYTGDLEFQQGYGFRVADCEFGPMVNVERDYGINVFQSDAWVIERCTATGVRHFWTTGARQGATLTTSRWGTNSGDLIDCEAYVTGLDDTDTSSAMFSEHPEALDVRHIRCIVRSSGDSATGGVGVATLGFVARGRKMQYIACEVHGSPGANNRGWQLRSAPDAELIGCKGVGLSIGVEVEPYQAGDPDSNRARIEDCVFRDITNCAILVDGGDGHYISGEFENVGQDNTFGGFVGAQKAAIAFTTHLATADATNVTFGRLKIDKQSNDYSIYFDNVSPNEVTFEAVDSDISGWDRFDVGFDRTSVNAPAFERKFHYVNEAEGTLQQADGHTLVIDDDEFAPVVVGSTSTTFDRYDDTQAGDTFVGVLLDVVNNNWIWLAKGGDRFIAPIARLENAASPGNVSSYLSLYWDEDAVAGVDTGGYSRALPGDSAEANAFVQATEIGTSEVVFQVVTGIGSSNATSAAAAYLQASQADMIAASTAGEKQFYRHSVNGFNFVWTGAGLEYESDERAEIAAATDLVGATGVLSHTNPAAEIESGMRVNLDDGTTVRSDGIEWLQIQGSTGSSTGTWQLNTYTIANDNQSIVSIATTSTAVESFVQIRGDTLLTSDDYTIVGNTLVFSAELQTRIRAGDVVEVRTLV